MGQLNKDMGLKSFAVTKEYFLGIKVMKDEYALGDYISLVEALIELIEIWCNGVPTMFNKISV